MLLQLFRREATWVAQGVDWRRRLGRFHNVALRYPSRRWLKKSGDAEHAKVDAEQNAERERDHQGWKRILFPHHLWLSLKFRAHKYL